MRIEDEIKTRKFQNAQHKATVNIIFTAGWLNSIMNQWLKPYDLSHQQYNILRILNSQAKAISIVDIKCRMLDRMSNVSRLVEKLRIKGYIERAECHMDRRLVEIKITEDGRNFLDQLTQSMPDALRAEASLNNEEAELLSSLLDKLRADDQGCPIEEED